jgi:prepilin-type N-terminal cleavage/methylation domain-containing protein/prepilin-type processing-associated H-X9-DG protein
MRNRRGFTLIEFLVVMAIIAVIIALYLSSLVGARSAAQRIQCMNNLKQIELALQNYLSSCNVLPSGSYDPVRPVASEPGGYKMSWIVSILPYLEQWGVQKALDYQHGADDPSNQTARMTSINSLICPNGSPVGRNWFAGTAPYTPGAFNPGMSSYAGCHHDVESPIDEDNHGVFYLNSHVRESDVTDGLSQTIFVGEVPWQSYAGWISGSRATLRNTGHPINSIFPGSLEFLGADSWRLRDRLSAIELYQMIDSNELEVVPTFVGGFGSSHVGDGANFGFGDGSVRFLRANIDQAVYRHLGHRSDGELIDGESY